MTPDPPITPPPDPPATAPPVAPPTVPVVPAPAPTPPEPSAELDGKAKAQAAYFARHPDEFELTMQHLEQAGHIQANARIDELQRDIAVRDAIAEHGLSKDDIPFIPGATPEEINASAAALKARYDAAAGTPPPDPPATATIPVKRMGQPIKPGTSGEAPPVTPPSTPPPVLSETVVGSDGVPSVEAAKDELRKSLEGATYE